MPMSSQMTWNKKRSHPQETRTMMSSSGRRKRVIPMSFQITGFGLNLLSRVHNEWPARVLSQLWFTVFKSKPKQWVDEFWQQADELITIHLIDKSLPIYSWGKGPLVILMHGWSGSGTQFRYFIPALVAAGYQVITFDAPAHGQNDGRRSHLLEFTNTLLAIQQQVGVVNTVIAHSLGAMAATLAFQRGLKAQHLVMMAPHLDVEKMFKSYSELLNLRPALANRFRDLSGQKMYEILGQQDPWGILNPPALLNDKTPTGMLVHDQKDEEVDSSLFEEIEMTWKDCTSFKTEGLGHNRILKDDAVIQVVLSYLYKKRDP
jgi:pimeloyl-ACP methyl ester carboxylesterase